MKILDILNENKLPKYIAHYNQVKNGEQLQAIYQAIGSGDMNKAKKLMNGNLETYSHAMTKALEDNELRIADVLLKMGANPNVNNGNIISHAAAKGELNKLQLLHKHGGDLSVDATLNWAIQKGNVDTVQWLKSKGVKANKETFNMLFRFLIGDGKRNPELVTPMVKSVLSMNPKTSQFHYPDMLEATKGNEKANLMIRQFGKQNGLTDKNEYDNLGNLKGH